MHDFDFFLNLNLGQLMIVLNKFDLIINNASNYVPNKKINHFIYQHVLK